MAEHAWQFWIDVGGTFTDCLARRPDGVLLRHKVLSSGATKGCSEPGSSPECLVDSARQRDPENFWTGYELHRLDRSGQPGDSAPIVSFDRTTGALHLGRKLSGITAGQAYEIRTREEAPLLAIRYLLGLPRSAPLPQCTVKLGTTRGTNALLTRRGARCALVTTRGFADILRIGYQNRPRLFELAIRKPLPLSVATAEIDERVTADGHVLRSPDADQVRQVLSQLKQDGIESLAICLLHAYQFPAHEQLVAQIARQVGFDEISCSSEVAPFIKIVSRGDTTVVDAYLNPVLRTYVQRLRQAASSPQESGGSSMDLRLLTSAGGLVAADQFRGKDSILSGPAGGVVGFSRVAQAAGFSHAIGFDMGGTSTDVSRFDGQFEQEYETEKAGVRIVTPMLAIETVAAGGGSICWYDGVKLCVGPDSAGADPGPACYGRGGPLTVTDLNFYLGRISPDYFPFPLHRQPVVDRLEELAAQLAIADKASYTLPELAQGLLHVANAKMAKAIRSISVAKGYDPREYVLVPFGGAAGQHACEIASELGITCILAHPDAGLLSAYGIGLADVTRHFATGIYAPYGSAALAEAQSAWRQMADEAQTAVRAVGISADRISLHKSLDLRYAGTDKSLTIAEPVDGDFEQAFTQLHRQLFGYVHANRPLEIVAARVEAVGESGEQAPPSSSVTAVHPPRPTLVTAFFGGCFRETPTFPRDVLRPGHRLSGPAIVLEPTSTLVIDEGWQAEVLSGGELCLTKIPAERRQSQASVSADDATSPAVPDSADPIQLEIFNNHFAAIAEQMGITLRSTASSVNVKERLDFSCALFTARGELVVNAPHIPVHLGAMGETVRRIIADNPELNPGDVLVTNDPYRGGSHLPDITVVTPVFDRMGQQLLFFTANRAHHAEIGGISPGSMPPHSRTLAEEGVLIRNFKVVAAGESRMDELRELFVSAPFPTRSVNDNLYDISAQIAANQQGCRDLLRLVERFSWPVVARYMEFIQAAAEQKMRQALARLPDGRREFTDHLDDGSRISVAIEIRGETADIDFAGTGPVLTGNLNANRAIVTAAVMYALRCLLDEDIPLNQGVLAPIAIRLPECLLNPPERSSPAECAAVAGGNVETSQRVVDVLLGAFGLAAASQGTMNNLLFGDATFGYYETICGGAGATADAAGADAVHTHMTNTRLTDPEVLERRYPVRVREFSIRRGSGGGGTQRGGDGVVRCLEFLRDVDLSILSQRRGDFAPYGVLGGEPGTRGRNRLIRRDGTELDFPGIARSQVQAGDAIVIETPGGGGWGKAGPSA